MKIFLVFLVFAPMLVLANGQNVQGVTSIEISDAANQDYYLRRNMGILFALIADNEALVDKEFAAQESDRDIENMVTFKQDARRMIDEIRVWQANSGKRDHNGYVERIYSGRDTEDYLQWSQRRRQITGLIKERIELAILAERAKRHQESGGRFRFNRILPFF